MIFHALLLLREKSFFMNRHNHTKTQIKLLHFTHLCFVAACDELARLNTVIFAVASNKEQPDNDKNLTDQRQKPQNSALKALTMITKPAISFAKLWSPIMQAD